MRKSSGKHYLGGSFLLRVPATLYFTRNYDKLPEEQYSKLKKVLLLSSVIFYSSHHFVINFKNNSSQDNESEKYISFF